MFSLTERRRVLDNLGMGLADRDYMKAESWQRDQRQRLAARQWRNFPRPWRNATPRQQLTRYVLVAAITLAPGAAVGYAAGAKVGPFKPATEPLLVWGGESFNSRVEFEAWLVPRGGSYEAWAAKHPAAAARLEGRFP
jgi:hypothetical protein